MKSPEDLKSLADEELMSRFAATRAHGFLDELVRRYHRRVLAGSHAVLRDRGDAEDVAQDAFAIVFTRAGQFNGGSFSAWLFKIARNLSLDALEKRRTTVPMEETLAGSDSDDLPRMTEVGEALARLSRPQRICLRLLYEKGLTYREISGQTGYSEKAVKAYIQNGREKFRRMWERRGENGSRP